ncbi:hypothetical protein M501DRAFT_1016317 [Patellaria atrata CBS 101060]|uniref:DNA repair protein Dds20/Mei5 n=1 Tax=Patellaria atrata CBS 101060 TaxID=1346257 RepID=A0A9P4SCR9_9PEZI|nr:hypothetical protein M501DRAFT_1016317 [Patellaria atrata CBS 101060]
MTTQIAKKRRLNNAASILSKPFISPLKTHNQEALTTNPNALRTPAYTQSPLAASTTVAEGIDNPVANDKVLSSQPALSPSSTKHIIKGKNVADPEFSELMRYHRQLESQIRNTRNGLDTLQQALKIEQSGQDEELEKLISRWKTASREAAEEVFAGVKDRVNRMGGVDAWRQREKRQDEWKKQWDEETTAQDPNDEDDEDDEEENAHGRGLTAEEKKSLRQQLREHYDDGDSHQHDEQKFVEDHGQEDDTFTMDMMLKSLNIDLNVIGYCKDQQRWVD